MFIVSDPSGSGSETLAGIPPGGDQRGGVVAVLGPQAQHEAERKHARPRHLGAQAQHTEKHGGRWHEQVRYGLHKGQ